MYWLLLILLFIPRLGNAECAWVLWSKFAEVSIYEGEGERAWKVERALKSVDECQTLLKKVVNITAKHFNGPNAEVKVVFGDTNGLIVRSGKNTDGSRWSYNHDFLCLPDNIDPRSSKY